MRQGKNRKSLKYSVSIGAVLVATLGCAPAFAQQDPAPAASAEEVMPNEILVTARRSKETAISVPVTLTAVGGAELQQRNFNQLQDLGRLVPQLQIGDAAGSVQGGNVVIRGISSGDSNPFADQSVSFNIDGAQVARATVRRMAQMDISQVEVLKGPQALFFGKNSPGGVISIQTADPSDHFEARVSTGFEVNARELRGEGYISGPLSDTVGIRVAGYGSTMRGWVKNIAPATVAFPPSYSHYPRDREFAGRLTLTFRPSDRFDARFKATYNELSGAGPAANGQYVDCPTGVPQFGDLDECKPNDKVIRGNLGPNFGRVDPAFGDGHPRHEQRQWLSSLEMNYHLTDQLTVTSLTSYYDVDYEAIDNFTATTNAARILASNNFFGTREISQEVRLASDFDGWINFLTGAYYQDGKAYNGYHVLLNGAVTNPTDFANLRTEQDTTAYSFFGQVRVNPIEQIELSAGGRYSKEKKRFRGFALQTTPVANVRPERSFNNFSPEFSISYRPTNRFTAYASYKRGFLSGGFNGGTGSLATDRSYDQQKIKGFEGGIKAELADRTVRLNLSAYNYVVHGLQVTTVINTVNNVVNAGKATIKGLEGDISWTTPMEGLTLRGALGYNHGRYNRFTIACYRGQTIAQGCNMAPVNGVFTLQDLGGHEIVRSPDLTGTASASYETPIGHDLKLLLTGDASYSDGFDTLAQAPPRGRQSSYWLFNASVRVTTPTGWEFALIGDNLSNKYYFTRIAENTGSGTVAGTAGPSTTADIVAAVSRGRQITFRVSYKL